MRTDRSKPVLSHTRLTSEGSEAERWLFVLHGIYGSGRNWLNVARRLVDDRPTWGVILVDLRLHGGSTGFAPPHTVEACAQDLSDLEATLGVRPSAILGHSFGGKVALVRGNRDPAGVEQVWIADSPLEPGVPSGSAWQVVEIVRTLPKRFESRDQLVDAMAAHGYDRGMGQWLAMNLEREGGGFRWRLDWEGVEDLLRDYFAADVWPMIEDPPPGLAIHVIRAIDSDALDPGSLERLRKIGERVARVHLHEIRGGHWLNVDNPDGVLELLKEEL